MQSIKISWYTIWSTFALEPSNECLDSLGTVLGVKLLLTSCHPGSTTLFGRANGYFFWTVYHRS